MENFTLDRDILRQYQPKELKLTPHTAAVLLILLTSETNSIEIVLTQRAVSLPTYAGHYSFPGGMKEANDSNLYATATRETYEELNLSENSYQFIGQLDDFADRNDNLVRPFMAIMKKADFLKLHKISPAEIASVYYFSLDKLAKIKDDPDLHQVTRRRPSYAFRENEVFIWGLTATILVHFYNVLYGKSNPLGKKI